MNKLAKILSLTLCAAVLAGWTSTLLGGDALTEKNKAQNKLLAYRAARVDAMRKLSERINGLVIKSETKVKDFVTESDKIKTAMEGWLSGMEEDGEPKYMEDGTCEVTLKVPVDALVIELQRLYKEYYKGNKIQIEDFKSISAHTETKYFKETGRGAPRPELQEAPLVVPAAGATEAAFDGASAAARKYWATYCTGQGRLMAERAARLDALRRLSERIYGLAITSKTTVRDFVAENDEIKTAMTQFIKNMKEVGRRYHENELIVEVEMQVKVGEVMAELENLRKEYYKGDRVSARDFTEVTMSIKESIIRETGMGVPPDKYLKDVPPAEAAVLQTKAPDWINTPVTATGNAAIDTANDNKAQAKLMAIRGAELDARRKLAEQIDGLMITSKTSVKDFVAESDKIHTAMLTFQQGGSVVEGSQKVLDDGTVQVTVQIDPKPLWDAITYYERTLSIQIK